MRKEIKMKITKEGIEFTVPMSQKQWDKFSRDTTIALIIVIIVNVLALSTDIINSIPGLHNEIVIVIKIGIALFINMALLLLGLKLFNLYKPIYFFISITIILIVNYCLIIDVNNKAIILEERIQLLESLNQNVNIILISKEGVAEGTSITTSDGICNIKIEHISGNTVDFIITFTFSNS